MQPKHNKGVEAKNGKHLPQLQQPKQTEKSSVVTASNSLFLSPFHISLASSQTLAHVHSKPQMGFKTNLEKKNKSLMDQRQLPCPRFCTTLTCFAFLVAFFYVCLIWGGELFFVSSFPILLSTFSKLPNKKSDHQFCFTLFYRPLREAVKFKLIFWLLILMLKENTTRINVGNDVIFSAAS